MPTPHHAVLAALESARHGRAEAAAAQLRRHLASHPSDLLARTALGQVLMQVGLDDQALYQFEWCARAVPGAPAHHNNLGMALASRARWPEAIAAFRESIRLDPAYAIGWTGLALALLNAGDCRAAADAARCAIALQSALGDAHLNLGVTLLDVGRVEEAVAAMRAGLEIVPNHAALRSALLIALNLREGLSPEELRAEHERYARRFPPTPGLAPARTEPDPERRLRVGILSSDLHRHSVAFFLEPILEHRDHAAVEYVLFPTGRTRDQTSARLRARAGAWVDSLAPDPAAAARAIRDRRIDILLELGGHSAGSPILAVIDKPAPVIITAIGYPNTTGLPSVDYRLVDTLTDPPGSESHSTERLLRLDPCFLCYRPPSPDEAPPPSPRAPGPITLGSFNTLQKISPETLHAWSAILARVPGSRLLLKAKGLAEAWTRSTLLDRLAAAAIDPARVELLDRTPDPAAHLALYARLDIALDTFPYNGTTTTCEALWMGVPVIALAGRRHAARVGLSLLSAAGLPELVAHTPDDYIRLAAELAANPARLDSLRASLRTRLAASPLCDGPAYARRFEALLRHAWRARCASAREPG